MFDVLTLRFYANSLAKKTTPVIGFWGAQRLGYFWFSGRCDWWCNGRCDGFDSWAEPGRGGKRGRQARWGARGEDIARLAKARRVDAGQGRGRRARPLSETTHDG